MDQHIKKMIPEMSIKFEERYSELERRIMKKFTVGGRTKRRCRQKS